MRKTLGLLADAGSYGLATDFYQLMMAGGYFTAGMREVTATFELFVRRLPDDRGYLLAAGLEQAVEFLLGLRFDGESIDYLRAFPQFTRLPAEFWEYLRDLRFTGDVNAVPEGTVAFPHEPLLQVRAPIIQGQLVETFILAAINHQTLIASKAARVVDAAAGRGVIEFGARRAHGFDAAVYGARAAVIGGCMGTSNVLAGRTFGIPVYGTAAHSFVMAFEHERDAFRSFHRTFPEHGVFLLDTYDTLEGARRVVELGPSVRGVRLDSGDVVAQSFQVRRILDEGGLQNTSIMLSGDFNEYSVEQAVRAGAPVQYFGVGTELITSRDAPALGGVYKLVAVDQDGEHRPVRKLSPGKVTYPDVKQVFRTHGPDSKLARDTLACAWETHPGERLLTPVLRTGRLVTELPLLPEIQARARKQREALPAAVRRLHAPEPYPVAISAPLRALTDELHPGT